LPLMRQYAVVGSGYMGGGIAQVLALSGAAVVIADVSKAVAVKNYDRLLAESETFVADGLLAPGSTELLEENLKPVASVDEAVAGAEFIEESVIEDVEVKRDVLSAISSAAPSAAIIGSNTSTISIGTLAEAVRGPGRFLGVHFSNPAPFVPGVELIPHAQTEPRALATVEEIIAGVGKQAARVRDVTGFVLNRLQFALFKEAAQLAEDKVASIEDIDRIVRTTFGFRLPFFGPFAIADMAGLDVYAASYRSLEATFPDRFEAPKILQRLIQAGRFGTKSGGGFFDASGPQAEALVAYRNKAYVALQKLLDELGPAPIAPAAED
jgi:3-hydroxybutyryl-CoA dehydrogenase